MINFEQEIKKFHPSLEIEDVEKAIYNQDMKDMVDVMVGAARDSMKGPENSPQYNPNMRY